MTKPKDPNDMTETELADYYYQHRHEVDGEEVSNEMEDSPKPVTISFGFRLPQQEARAIRAAADAEGLSVSEFIRSACRLRIASGHAGGITAALAPHLPGRRRI